MVRIYQSNPVVALLIVGHSPRTGDLEQSAQLSLERAEAVRDYLTNNTLGWLKGYGARVSPVRRWGEREDLLMAHALQQMAGQSVQEPLITWYQRTRQLDIDEEGNADFDTRRALISDYMAIKGEALRANASITVHGCGEHFRYDPAPEVLDSPDERWIDVFFFFRPDGIVPKPPGKYSKRGSPEYSEWIAQTQRSLDYYVRSDAPLIRGEAPLEEAALSDTSPLAFAETEDLGELVAAVTQELTPVSKLR